jgi:hypothetical protein
MRQKTEDRRDRRKEPGERDKRQEDNRRFLGIRLKGSLGHGLGLKDSLG